MYKKRGKQICAVEVREKIEKIKESPYFARIDFVYDGEEEAETYYIGRFGFTHHKENLIFDWRAPISGMFYDYDTGRAGFEAPVGWMEGDLTRKRQFKIKDGIMEYAIESSTNVQDEVLQKELANTADEKMKSIISTIQREQNVVIRNESANTLIFEGLEENRFVKHLVIDEMQDYTPIQFAVINRMYPCQKTILGDFGQVLNPCHLHSLDEIRRIYKDGEFVALNKSYRSTYEIMEFAKNISVDNFGHKWGGDWVHFKAYQHFEKAE